MVPGCIQDYYSGKTLHTHIIAPNMDVECKRWIVPPTLAISIANSDVS